jgi:4-amino-4-deoxy-L-arabinose transferase-like glycosyltransferase
VARLWNYAATPDPAIAAVFSLYAVLLVLSLLIGGVASLHSRRLGYLAGFALFATPGLMFQVMWQLADIPTSFFLAASLALILTSPKQRDPWTFLLLAGVMAGAAAWTKNEGLLFGLAERHFANAPDPWQLFSPDSPSQSRWS